MTQIEESPYYKYAKAVLSGEVVAGELVKLACRRFFAFLENPAYEFRPEAVERVIEFASTLHHFTGKHANRPFIFEPWEAFAIANVYGFFRKDDGSRLTRYAYIEVSRKNGKTALGAAGFALYGLIADGEENAQVDLAANSKDQAKICFDMCANFAKSLDPESEYLDIYRDQIRFDYTKSRLRVMSASDKTNDGFNSSLWVLDEYHSAENQRLKDLLQSSQGMRDNPLGVIITTAGFNKLGPCYQYRTVCTEILYGAKQDDSIFSLIYTLDDGDDWKDENVWIKSNPNLGITVKKDYLRSQVNLAINNPSEEVGVKTKNFNVWCDAEDVWIPDHYVLSATQDLNIEDFKGEDCYVGVDLSATTDLTAVSFLIPKDDKLYFFNKAYLPRASLVENRFKELYGSWARQRALTVTPGNVVDYDYILNDIMDVGKNVYIQKVGYDTWNATQFTINATDAGLPMEPVSQTIGNYNRPTSEFARLMLSGKIVLDSNIITRHCLRNVALARDRNGNVKPTKQYAEKKVDIVMSMLNATYVYLMSPRYGELY